MKSEESLSRQTKIEDNQDFLKTSVDEESTTEVDVAEMEVGVQEAVSGVEQTTDDFLAHPDISSEERQEMEDVKAEAVNLKKSFLGRLREILTERLAERRENRKVNNFRSKLDQLFERLKAEKRKNKKRKKGSDDMPSWDYTNKDTSVDGFKIADVRYKDLYDLLESLKGIEGQERDWHRLFELAKEMFINLLDRGELEKAIELYYHLPDSEEILFFINAIRKNIDNTFEANYQKKVDDFSTKEEYWGDRDKARVQFFQETLGQYPDLFSAVYFDNHRYQASDEFKCDGDKQLEMFRQIRAMGNRDAVLTRFDVGLLPIERLSGEEVDALFESYKKFNPYKILRNIYFFKSRFVELSESEKDEILLPIFEKERQNMFNLWGFHEYLRIFPLTTEQANSFVKYCVDVNRWGDLSKAIEMVFKIYPQVFLFDSNLKKISNLLGFDLNVDDQKKAIQICLGSYHAAFDGNLANLNAVLQKEKSECSGLEDQDKEQGLLNLINMIRSFGSLNFGYLFDFVKKEKPEVRRRVIDELKKVKLLELIIFGFEFLTDTEKGDVIDYDTIKPNDLFGNDGVSRDVMVEIDKMSPDIRQRMYAQIFGHLSGGNLILIFKGILKYTEHKDELKNYILQNLGEVLGCKDSLDELRKDPDEFNYLVGDELSEEDKHFVHLNEEFDDKIFSIYSGRYGCGVTTIGETREKVPLFADVPAIPMNKENRVGSQSVGKLIHDLGMSEAEQTRFLDSLVNSPESISQLFRSYIPGGPNKEFFDTTFLPQGQGGLLSSEQFDLMRNKLLKVEPGVVYNFYLEMEVSDEELYELEKAFLKVSPKVLLELYINDLDTLGIFSRLEDKNELIDRVSKTDPLLVFSARRKLGLDKPKCLELIGLIYLGSFSLDRESGWGRISIVNLEVDERIALLDRIIAEDPFRLIENFNTLSLSPEQKVSFFNKMFLENNFVIFLEKISGSGIVFSPTEQRMIFQKSLETKTLSKWFSFLAGKVSKDELLGYLIHDVEVRKKFMAEFARSYPLAFTGLTGTEGKGTDNITPLLQYFYEKHDFQLDDSNAEVFSGYVKEFGVSTSDVLFRYYKNIIDKKNGLIEELPDEQLDSGLDTVAKLRERSLAIRKALIDGELLPPTEMTELDYDILKIETRFETSRWARPGKNIADMYRDFYALQAGGKIEGLHVGYEEDNLQVDRVETKKIDYSDCQTEYSRLRADLLSAHELLGLDGLGKFKQKLIESLSSEIDNIVIVPDDNPKKVENLERRRNFLTRCLTEVSETDDLNKIMKSLMKLEIDLGIKSENSGTSPFLRTILFSRVIENHSGFGQLPDEMRFSEQANLEGLQYVRDMVQNVIKQHVLLTGDLRQGKEGEKRVRDAIKKYFGGVKDNFPTVVEAGRLAKNLLTSKISELLRNIEGDISGSKQKIRMIPDRGFVGELSGYYADACWTSQEMFLRDWPNITPYKFVTGEEKDQEIIGSVLFIESEDQNGEKVIIVRGLNPRDKYLNTLQGESFCEEVFESAKRAAERIGAKKVLVAGASGSTSNREKVNSYVGLTYRNDNNKVNLYKPFAFNGYQIQHECYLVREVVDETKK